MTEVKLIRADQREVFPADATSGMVREQALAGEGIWAGLVRTAPMRPSGWHHHGDHDTYVYVEAGRVKVEFGPDGTKVVEAGPGDFIHVPKGAIHREANPDVDEGVAIVLRVGSGPPVVNVDGPAPQA
ncbi:MAG: cupin domain-containing protein [Acidimicrobiia bacterium]